MYLLKVPFDVVEPNIDCFPLLRPKHQQHIAKKAFQPKKGHLILLYANKSDNHNSIAVIHLDSVNVCPQLESKKSQGATLFLHLERVGHSEVVCIRDEDG